MQTKNKSVIGTGPIKNDDYKSAKNDYLSINVPKNVQWSTAATSTDEHKESISKAGNVPLYLQKMKVVNLWCMMIL